MNFFITIQYHVLFNPIACITKEFATNICILLWEHFIHALINSENKIRKSTMSADYVIVKLK